MKAQSQPPRRSTTTAAVVVILLFSLVTVAATVAPPPEAAARTTMAQLNPLASTTTTTTTSIISHVLSEVDTDADTLAAATAAAVDTGKIMGMETTASAQYNHLPPVTGMTETEVERLVTSNKRPVKETPRPEPSKEEQKKREEAVAPVKKAASTEEAKPKPAGAAFSAPRLQPGSSVEEEPTTTTTTLGAAEAPVGASFGGFGFSCHLSHPYWTLHTKVPASPSGTRPFWSSGNGYVEMNNPQFLDVNQSTSINTQGKGSVTLQLWVKLNSAQDASRPTLFHAVGPTFYHRMSGPAPTRTKLDLYWNSKAARIEGKIVTNNGTETTFQGKGTVPLTNSQWRLVTLVLDVDTMRTDGDYGQVLVLIDSVLEVHHKVPALIREGLTFSHPLGSVVGSDSMLLIGCKGSGNNDCLDGEIGDFTILPRVMTWAEVLYTYQFRLPEHGCVHLASPALIANLPQGAMSYRFFVDEKTPGSKYFSYPGSTIPWHTGGFVNTSKHFHQHPQIIEPVQNITMSDNTACAVTSATSIKGSINLSPFPTNHVWFNQYATWHVTFTFYQPPGAAVLSSTDKLTLIATNLGTSGTAKQNILERNFPQTNVTTLTFIFQGSMLNFELMTQTAGRFCLMPTAKVQYYGYASFNAGSHALLEAFANTSTELTVLSGVGPADAVGIIPSGSMDCTQVSKMYPVSANMLKSTPSYYALTIFLDTAATASTGTFNICVFPGGVASAQAFVPMPSFNFPSRLSVFPLPSIAQPLPLGLVDSLLHLGTTYDSYIPHGSLTTDYFASAGGENKIEPAAGDSLGAAGAGNNLIWTPLSVSNGVWGKTSPSENNWVQYFAIAIYSPVPSQTIQFSVSHCAGMNAWLDGNRIYHYSICDQGPNVVRYSDASTVSQGWHQLVFKLYKYYNHSYLDFRIVQGTGLSWNYQIPRGSGGAPIAVNYTNQCLLSARNGNVQMCLANVTETECYDAGCCYNASLTAGPSGPCFLPVGPKPKYRSDSRCGAGFVAPGSSVAECNPFSSVGATCCSVHGWCGNSTGHCECRGCVDYDFLNLDGGRCTFKSWGKETVCYGIPSAVISTSMMSSTCRSTCEFNPRCTAYSLGLGWRYYETECVHYYDQQCDVTQTHYEYRETFRKFCNCSMTQNCTSCACSSSSPSYYYGQVSYSECQRQCSLSDTCEGVEFTDNGASSGAGDCAFHFSSCKTRTNTSNTQMADYTCLNQNMMPPTPMPPPGPNNTNYVNTSSSYQFLACLPDSYGEILASRWDGANWNGSIVNMTLEKCYSYCLNYRGTQFFAVAQGSICQCGVRYPLDAERRDPQTYCATPCPGNSSQACGGKVSTAVYQMSLIQGPCQNGYYQFQNHCYKYYGGDSNWKTWKGANAICVNDGARLTSITDVVENQFLLSLAFMLNTSNTTRTFVGAMDSGYGNGFEWMDGTPWSFTDWRWGEPNYGGGTSINEDCVEIFSNYPTPWKGSWNDRSCMDPLPFICEMSTNGTANANIENAEIDLMWAAGSYACAPASLAQHIQANLQAWWPLDSLSSGSTTTFPDQTGNGHILTFSYNTSLGMTPQPSFDSGVLGTATVFDGKNYLVAANSPAWNIATNANDGKTSSITVAAWVNLKSIDRNAVIVSRSAKATVNVANISQPQYAWALTVQGGQYCFVVGLLSTCAPASATTALMWTHVAGTFDGDRYTIFINGHALNANIISWNNDPATVNSSQWIPSSVEAVVVGYRSALPYDPTIIFQGEMDDVRIYDAALAAADILYLQKCVIDAAPANHLQFYISDSSSSGGGGTISSFIYIMFFGHGFQRGERFLLSPNACPLQTNPSGNIIEGSVMMYPLQHADGLTHAYSFIPGSLTSDVSSNYMCAPTAMDQQLFIESYPFKVDIVQIQQINSTSNKFPVVVNYTNFPATLTLTGQNLGKAQRIIVSLHPTCNNVESIVPLTNVNPMGTSATIVVPEPLELTDTLYLCWAATQDAIPIPAANGGGSSSGSGTNPPTNSGYLSNTGFQLFIYRAGGNMKRIAAVSGTHAIFDSTFINGQYWSKSDFILPCGDSDMNFGDHFVLRVSMGVYADYLVPKKGVTLCQMLTQSNTGATKPSYSYSSMNPTSNLFDGRLEPVPPGPDTVLGGSSQYWSNDGREYLSIWGTQRSSSSWIGGCCQSSQFHYPEWYQSYTMVLVDLNPNNMFLHLHFPPTAIYLGEQFLVTAQVLDIHGDIVMMPVQFSVAFVGLSPSSTNVKPMNMMNSPNGSLMASFTVNPADLLTSTSSTFQIVITTNVSLATQSNVTVNVQVFMAPANATTLPSGRYVTSMLKLGNESSGSIPTDGLSGYWTDWFPHYGGEANLHPVEGDTLTADDMRQTTLMWQKETKPYPGKWGTYIQDYSVQFYAFALYSPIQQPIQVSFWVDDTCKFYLDGNFLAGSSKPFDGFRISNPVTVNPGWHQVVIKLEDWAALSVLQFSLYGSALAMTYQMPPTFPNGVAPLPPHTTVNQMLHLGANPSDVILGNFDTDYLFTEELAQPKIGQVTKGLTWSWMTNPSTNNGKWYLNAPTSSTTYVTYYSLAVYSTFARSYSFSVSYNGPFKFLVDGTTVVYSAGTTTGTVTKAVSLVLSVGWHQMIFKLGSSSNPVFFTLQLLGSGGASGMAGPGSYSLGFAPQIPEALPTTAEPLGAQLMNVMMLATDMGKKVYTPAMPPGATAYGAKFPATTPLVNVSIDPLSFDTVTLNISGMKQTYYWLPAITAANGQIGSRPNIGGNWDGYYSVALYSAKNQSVSADVIHNAGYQLWMDGALVSKSATPDSISLAGTRVTLNLRDGWQQIIFQLHAKNDLHLIPVDSTTTYAQSHQICHNQRKQLCLQQALCPFNAPRAGVFPTTEYASQWIPVGDAANAWVQTGVFANSSKTCQRWSDTHRGTPSWSTQQVPIYDRRVIACCNSGLQPGISITFPSDNPNMPQGTQLGWSYEFPQAPVHAPIISIDSPNTIAPTVTMWTSTPGAYIVFTTDGTTPSGKNGLKYTKPFQVRSDTTILAITIRTVTKYSRVVKFEVIIPTTKTVGRKSCVPYALTPIPISGLEAGVYVSIVDIAWTKFSQMLSLSAALAEPASAWYSGVLTIGPDMTVPFGTRAGSYEVIYYPGTGANTVPSMQNGTGIAIPDIIKFQNISMTPSAVVQGQEVSITFAAGVAAGDSVLLLEQYQPQAAGGPCTATVCSTALTAADAASFILHPMTSAVLPQGSTAVTTFALAGEIRCLCYAATGTNVNNDIPMTSLATAVPIEFTVVPNPVGPVTPTPPGTTPTPGAPTPTVQAAVITAASPSVIYNKQTLTISGLFFDLLPSHHTVGFIYEVAGATMPFPPAPVGCPVITVTSQTLTCKLDVDPGTSGIWKVSVQENERDAVSSANASSALIITAVPDTPIILGASGDCITKSSFCVSGTLLTFFGVNFDPITPSFNKIEFIDFADGKSSSLLSCRVTTVYNTNMSCILTVTQTSLKGEYAVRITVSTTATVSTTSQPHGSIMLGAGDAPGWTGNAAPGTNPGPSGDGDAAKKSSLYLYIIIALGGVIFLGLVTFMIIRLKFQFVRRHAANNPDAEYMEEAFLADRQHPGGNVLINSGGGNGERLAI